MSGILSSAQRQKFTLRQMFIGLIAGTTAIYCGLSFWATVNGNHDEIRRLLYAHPKVYDVKIWTIGQGIADLATDVEHVQFKIVGRPKSCIEISVPRTDLFTAADSIALSRIADIYLHAGYSDSATGLQAWSSVDVGDASELHSVLPCTVTNLDELIQNYDKFVTASRKWPTGARNGAIHTSPTRRLEYWATSAE